MDDEFECSTCNAYYHISKLAHCSCGSNICNDCYVNKKDVIILKEWLDSVPNQCEKCKTMCCAKCIRTCFTCGNLGNNINFMCDKCSDVVKLDCKYHIWYVCSKCLFAKERCKYDRCNYEINEMLEDLHLSQLPIRAPPLEIKCPECAINKNYHLKNGFNSF